MLSSIQNKKRNYTLICLGLFLVFTLICVTSQAQVLSKFTWDSNPVTKAVVGPDAIKVGSATTSATGGAGGTNGLNAGPGKIDIDLTLSTSSGLFDVPGIDIGFDYQREENDGSFFKRGESLDMKGCQKLSVTYRVQNGAGGFSTVSSGDVYNIPNDDIYRTYRFYYLSSTGYGALLVDGVQVWSHDGPDNRDLYWTGAGNIIIGYRMDGSGNGKTFLDNFTTEGITTSNTLPIELSKFEAKVLNEKVTLNWQTISEKDNDFFTVERSIDGKKWEVMNKIKGAGNYNGTINYTTIDHQPHRGVSYYRLKQTDFNGEFSYSQTVSVDVENVRDTEMSVYPNPTLGQITLSTSQPLVSVVEVYDMFGKNVSNLTQQANTRSTEVTVDLSALRPGMYIIKVENEIKKVCKK